MTRLCSRLKTLSKISIQLRLLIMFNSNDPKDFSSKIDNDPLVPLLIRPAILSCISSCLNFYC